MRSDHPCEFPTADLQACGDLDWVALNLVLGGRLIESGLPALARVHGISHVVDLRAEEHDDAAVLGQHGIAFLHLPTPDRFPPNLEQLQTGAAWVDAAQREGGRVAIHCEHGIGRSALLAACVLVRQGAAPVEALTTLRTHRPCVGPSQAQLRMLLAFTWEWHRCRGTACPATDLEALLRVAYG
jgi:protein-tyrosine phosphatase